MLDKNPSAGAQATQVIACPPRHQARPADPCAMVIFGATGDLTKRLVMPALYNLLRTKVLPERFALIGVARGAETAESWRDHLYAMLKSFIGNRAAEFDVDEIDETAWQRLAAKMTYIQGDLGEPDAGFEEPLWQRLGLLGLDRLVAAVQYRAGVLAIRFFGSHAEYDRIDAETV